MAVAANADDYAEARVGIYFPGVIPSLDGQCVSLVKWFMGEMASVPDWNAARGDARYVGKTLVSQGHATEVPYAERKRGDIICYEYGTYGHIAVQLSNGRVFEENINWPGIGSKIVDGARVYASRIGSETESWRHDQHVYRLKTYKEGGGDMIPNLKYLDMLFQDTIGRNSTAAEQEKYIGKISSFELHDILRSQQAYKDRLKEREVGFVAVRDNWQKQIEDLKAGFEPVSEQLYRKKS